MVNREIIDSLTQAMEEAISSHGVNRGWPGRAPFTALPDMLGQRLSRSFALPHQNLNV